MKKIYLAVCIGIVSLAVFTGCGSEKSTGQPESTIETISLPAETENMKDIVDLPAKAENIKDIADPPAETGNTKDIADPPAETEDTEAEVDMGKFNDQLCGKVKTINSVDRFVIISEMFTVEDAQEGSIAVMEADGNKEEETVKVYFMDDAHFLLVKGNADGSNSSEREAGFSDMEENDVLELTGSRAATGDEFLSSEVKIIRVLK